MSYYNNYAPSWSSYIFISSHEDMKKELKLEDIGKELFFLTKQAFCETCNKTLKAFGSEDKAKALVEKHLGYKKYSEHKALVKTVDFSEFNKCTTADIAGTKANTERNQQLRDSFYGVARGQIERAIQSNEELIANVQITFGFTTREDEIPQCPKELADGFIIFTNEKAKGRLKISDLENISQLFDGTWGQDREEPRKQDLYDRASMMYYYLHIGGHYRFSNDVYDWDYPINYDAFVGHDTEPAGDCSFCNKTIESWNDVFEDEHKHVHRDCYKHSKEAKSLKWYVEETLPRQKEEAERKQREEERHAQWEKEYQERQNEKAQEVTTS